MGTRSEQVDAYVARSPEFARPILGRLRELVHDGCPEVAETLKWGAPHFEYHGLLAGMAAFKEHVSFGFWKGRLLEDPGGILGPAGFGGSGTLRLASVGDLPSEDVIRDYLRRAMELNEQGVKLPRAAPAVDRPALDVPEDLRAALETNPAARATFDDFSYSHRREYVEWITEAKREETRQKRLATALEWLAEGKSRNWKYERK